MLSDGSITVWIRRLEAQPESAAQVLWQRFFVRMTVLARRHLAGADLRIADEEDVALIAFERFHRGVLAGRFPRLDDRGDLWRILFALTVRVAATLQRDEGRLKRGAGAVRGDAGMEDDPPDNEPTPEELACMREGLERLLGALPDEQLRRIAVARMEGHTNAEIALELGCATVTVERRLRLIRELWRSIEGSCLG